MTITASIVGPTFLTVMLNGTTHTITNDQPNYNEIREALKIKDHVAVEKLINVAKAVTEYVNGRVCVIGDQVFYGDLEIKGSVVARIISMMREGFDANPIIKFLENLMSNPSKRAVDELYGFLEATSLPITDDGYFLAYKKVRGDYNDFYTGSVTNKPANFMSTAELARLPLKVNNVTVEVVNGVTTVSMPRNQVNEDKDQTCSYGLHFCSLNYLPCYYGGQGKVLIVKINPRDVVSIPSDYDNAKGRACRYEVIGEHTSEREGAFTSQVYHNTDPVDPGNYDSQNEWDAGYAAGEAKAEDDSNNRRLPNSSAPAGSSENFRYGFVTGYEDNYYIDWGVIGYDNAVNDVNAGVPYCDTPPSTCNEVSEYRTGYADGWHDQKVNQIGT
jgi:hypothetical protein